MDRIISFGEIQIDETHEIKGMLICKTLNSYANVSQQLINTDCCGRSFLHCPQRSFLRQYSCPYVTLSICIHTASSESLLTNRICKNDRIILTKRLGLQSCSPSLSFLPILILSLAILSLSLCHAVSCPRNRPT